ncbi:MAG: site-specific integrase [Clostridia bacterium]|nr:site-specific integrase [Clostridia bacterium]MBQ9878988.1 site-specific integrase [Clostridia bacterium]
MPVYKSDNGKWYCSFYYTAADGKRKRKKKEGFKTKREASDFEKTFIRAEGVTAMPFSELCDLYLSDLKVHIRASSFETALQQVNTYILPFFGGMKLSDISAATVREWQNTLLTSGRKTSYVKLINTRLNSVFTFAQKFYNLPENPMMRAGTIASAKSRQMEFWTKDEFDLFITTIEKPDLLCAFYVLFYTGMRCGELLALTIGDLDFEKNEISVNKTLTRVHSENILNPPKTANSERIVTVPEKIMNLLSDYVDRLYKPAPGDFLFPFVTPDKLRKSIKQGVKSVGIKRIRIHDLRHSHASWLIENGFPIQVVSERLGHSNTQMTLNVYAHLYPNKQAELAQDINKLIGDTEPILPKK